MQDLKFSTELSKRENARLNAGLKKDEKFCPCCGRVIKTMAELCDRGAKIQNIGKQQQRS
uniref:Uncharacterized protein n=1 Tax=viral metagenome TaxID=1070528 RepID=A0A6H2A1K5_9ZZZZ